MTLKLNITKEYLKDLRFYWNKCVKLRISRNGDWMILWKQCHTIGHLNFTYWYAFGIFPSDLFALQFSLLEGMLFLVLEFHLDVFKSPKFSLKLEYVLFYLLWHNKQSMNVKEYCASQRQTQFHQQSHNT